MNAIALLLTLAALGVAIELIDAKFSRNRQQRNLKRWRWPANGSK